MSPTGSIIVQTHHLMTHRTLSIERMKSPLPEEPYELDNPNDRDPHSRLQAAGRSCASRLLSAFGRERYLVMLSPKGPTASPLLERGEVYGFIAPRPARPWCGEASARWLVLFRSRSGHGRLIRAYRLVPDYVPHPACAFNLPPRTGRECRQMSCHIPFCIAKPVSRRSLSGLVAL